MKTLPLFLVLFVLSSAVLLGQKQQQPVIQKGRQVLFDFRQDRTSKSAPITAATQRLVLSKVFRKYLTDENKCRISRVVAVIISPRLAKQGRSLPQFPNR